MRAHLSHTQGTLSIVSRFPSAFSRRAQPWRVVMADDPLPPPPSPLLIDRGAGGAARPVGAAVASWRLRSSSVDWSGDDADAGEEPGAVVLSWVR